MRNNRPTIKIVLFTFTFILGLQSILAQSDEINATIINAQTQEALESVHVINLSQIKGTITDKDGNFTVPAVANDTLLLSYLGFKTIKV
ncbi:MAG TPA: hypothetical protein DCG56_03755, partial [Flavobacteriaceae bacterium]|nr:hypothetical protein [Flavobacteriaceae bacterium]